MKKHKRTTASKDSRQPKIAAKAQKVAEAVVRSPVRAAGAAPNESSSKRPSNSSQESDNLAAPLAENHGSQTMTDKTLSKGAYFSGATAIASAYQAKLLEMAQDNTQLAFECAQRLATIRSPLELPVVIAEFTTKRLNLFRRHTTELAGLCMKQ